MAKKQQSEESLLGEDTFLRDEVHPVRASLNVADGFRFGFGFMIALLLIVLIIGALTASAVALMR